MVCELIMIIKKEVTAGFNRGALTYNGAAKLQEKVAKELSLRLSGIEASEILEVGCGTGLLSQYLFQSFPQAEFVLIDIASKMIDVCHQRFNHANKINLLCADGEALAINQDFNLIASSMTIHWFANPLESMQKLALQLKPGGKFIFSMLGTSSLSEWKSICSEFNVSDATPIFPDFNFVRKELSEFVFEKKLIKHSYKNIQDFLSSLKLLGATTPRKDYTPLPSGKLREIMRVYNMPLEISYEIIYGEYSKI